MCLLDQAMIITTIINMNAWAEMAETHAVVDRCNQEVNLTIDTT